jgi:predicted NBD/HSP70 family sugar kinase
MLCFRCRWPGVGADEQLGDVAASHSRRHLRDRGGYARHTGLGIGVPVAAGSSLLLSWEDFSILGWLGIRYVAPAFVDNDVNFTALGEHWTHWRDTPLLVFVKVGTELGCGIVIDGQLHRARPRP